jgi:hypothetical protein
MSNGKPELALINHSSVLALQPSRRRPRCVGNPPETFTGVVDLPATPFLFGKVLLFAKVLLLGKALPASP